MTPSPLTALLAAALAAALLAGCAEPRFFTEENPPRLSDWKLFRQDGPRLLPSEQSLVFAPVNPLFSDYAGKLRTMWLPAGGQARIENGELAFPVGSVLSKTFYYPRGEDGKLLDAGAETAGDATELDRRQHRVIETRLLARRDDGWHAMTYVWNDEQSEAFLRVAGASVPVSLQRRDSLERGNSLERKNSPEQKNSNLEEFVYFVPNQNQCAGCHVTEHPDGPLRPLGAVPEQLAAARDTDPAIVTTMGHPPDSSQLQAMQARGWLAAAPAPPPAVAASWKDRSASLEARAGAYLNIHCGHCHNREGAADTSALVLDGGHRSPVELGVCKSPVAAGGGAGELLFNIHPGKPEQSILLYRMASAEPDEMMPELGRSLPHGEGIALLRDWIAAMPGGCPEPARALGNG
ncbi:MAG: hypothetical protein OXF43_01935 [Gammaproteobacteria bacterium]|nr:hypothetical protein [Gammaproteobacteria bacterium]